MARHIILDTAAPSAAPTAEGVHWIKTTDPKGAWLSVGTATVDDWLEQGAGGGGTALSVAGADLAGDPIVVSNVDTIGLDPTQFAITDMGSGDATVQLQPDFVASLGGGAPNFFPVWTQPTTARHVPGAAAAISNTPAVMSPAFAANRTWAIPFLMTQAGTIYALSMNLGGTVPAGNFEFSFQPFPGNNSPADIPVQYKEVLAFTALGAEVEQALTTPVVLEAGLHVLYVRAAAAAASMTCAQISSLGTGAGTTVHDPVAATLVHAELIGGCALTRNYNSGALDVGQFPHPFDDGTAVTTNTAPRVRLSIDWLAP